MSQKPTEVSRPRVAVVAGTKDPSASPVGISIAVSPLSEAVVIAVEGHPPVGLPLEDALELMRHLSDACQQLLDARKLSPRPQ